MKEIKLYKSSLQGFFLFLISLVFVIIGLFMINTDNGVEFIEGWFATLFFGLGVLVGLIMIFDKRPQIIINQKGIGYRKAIWKKYNPDKIIEWDTIKKIHWSSVNNQKFICLKTISKTPKQQNLVEKNLSKLNKSMGFEDTNIPLSMIKIDANKFVDFLGSMVVSNDSQREELIQTFIIPLPPSFFSKLKSKFKF